MSLSQAGNLTKKFESNFNTTIVTDDEIRQQETSDSISTSLSSIVSTFISITLIVTSLIVLIVASVASKRKARKNIERNNRIIDAIINNRENINIKSEIENVLEEQKNLEIPGIIESSKLYINLIMNVDKLPSLPSKLILTPLESMENIRYQINCYINSSFKFDYFTGYQILTKVSQCCLLSKLKDEIKHSNF